MLAAAAACAVMLAGGVLAGAAPASAGYGGGYGGERGNGIWSLAWWDGNPEGPGPYTGPPAEAVDLCIWHDTGTAVKDLTSALGESGLPESFWSPGNDRSGIWAIISWAVARVRSAKSSDHFDLVACPSESEVPPNSGDGNVSLPRSSPPGGKPLYLWIFWDTVPDPSPTALPPVIDEALQEVRIPAPAISTSPSKVHGVADATLVNVATWVWIDRSNWRTFSATATAGPYVATVWAEPVSVTWSASWDFANPASDPEHGTTLGSESLDRRCGGPGAPYPDEPACTVTFTQSTLGTRRPLRATEQWVVHWALMNQAGVVGGEGLLPDLYTSASLPIRVMQVESIIASG
jgi:hypothetical protein